MRKFVFAIAFCIGTQLFRALPPFSQSKKEIETIVALPEGSVDKFPESVIKKAIAHAQARIAIGKSPFLEPGTQEAEIRHLDREGKTLQKEISKFFAQPVKQQDPKELAKLMNKSLELSIRFDPIKEK